MVKGQTTAYLVNAFQGQGDILPPPLRKRLHKMEEEEEEDLKKLIPMLKMMEKENTLVDNLLNVFQDQEDILINTSKEEEMKKREEEEDLKKLAPMLKKME